MTRAAHADVEPDTQPVPLPRLRQVRQPSPESKKTPLPYLLTSIYIAVVLTAIFLLLLVDTIRH